MCQNWHALGGVDSVLTDAMVETGLPGFAHSVLADLAVWRQQQLKQGLTLRVAKQFLSCALVRGRGIVFRHYYKSIAKCAGKDFRDGAVVPFELVWIFCMQCMFVLCGFPLSLPFQV